MNGRSIIHQLAEEGVQLGYDTYTVPFGIDTVSAIYALGFATRSALTFGGMEAGQAREIMLYNKYRVFAFVLALGEVDDLKYATAAGAITYGFPVIADTHIPQILPTGVTTYEHVVSMPFDEIPGADDMERAEKLVQRCIEVRGVKVKIAKVPIPVAYGSAFEGERVRKESMQSSSAASAAHAFEYLRMRAVGRGRGRQDHGRRPRHRRRRGGRRACRWASSSRSPAARCRRTSSRSSSARSTTSSTAPRASSTSASATSPGSASARRRSPRASACEHLGKIIHARVHEVFGNIVDKVQVTLYHRPGRGRRAARGGARGLPRAQRAHRQRSPTSRSTPSTPARSASRFAPNHVCVVNPRARRPLRRLQLARLQGVASRSTRPGPNQPVPKGTCHRPGQGRVGASNEFVYAHSNQTRRAGHASTRSWTRR